MTQSSTADPVTIRPARLSDLQACRVIEDDAGAIFQKVGMADVDEDPPRSLDELRQAHIHRHLWIAVDKFDTPIAFALTEDVDGNLHLAEISVVQAWQREGVGRRLIEHLVTEGRSRGYRALTLTTFRDVPWNGPYYSRLGFEEIAAGDMLPGITSVMDSEAPQFLESTPRIAMRRVL
tara:strand:- start:300 stop:833 length:534 start_codon:yes stop_codon:yes gene_type:complete